MRRPPTFELVSIDQLRAHEEVDPVDVAQLAEAIRSEGAVDEPIWVARDSGVVLNGHHRLAALQVLGARRAPAWVLDYEDPEVVLEQWSSGPPITKEEVVQRAHAGSLFPPKTTRHRVHLPAGTHRIPLARLLRAADDHPGPEADSPRQPKRSRSSRGGAGPARAS